MTSEPVLMHQQEVRRQAMLQAMQLDVWLPRQQLLNAAQSRDYLLEWQAVDEVTVASGAPVVQPAADSRASAPAAASVARPPRSEVRLSVRDRLALAPASSNTKAATSATVADTPLEAEVVTPPSAAVQVEPIPRFALQLLRAGNCLVLVDLPTGEPFQSRDPDYQLLKDMLRAAGLTDKPSLMRQGAPIAWPMLHSGSLMHEQNAAAARACVRDLLTVELQAEPALCIWLVGQQALRFANLDDETPLYSVQPFAEDAQLWNLPSLERVLEQPLLKRDIWRSMCVVRSLWQVPHE